jgi:protein required for attachment to host cells
VETLENRKLEDNLAAEQHGKLQSSILKQWWLKTTMSAAAPRLLGIHMRQHDGIRVENGGCQMTSCMIMVNE